MNTSAATTETKGLTRVGEVKILWECGNGLAHRVGRSDLATCGRNEKGGWSRAKISSNFDGFSGGQFNRQSVQYDVLQHVTAKFSSIIFTSDLQHIRSTILCTPLAVVAALVATVFRICGIVDEVWEAILEMWVILELHIQCEQHMQ